MRLTLFDDLDPAPIAWAVIADRDDAHLVQLVLLLGELYGHGPWLSATVVLR